MPFEIDLTEFRAAFVAEADEYLATMRAMLQAIDAAARDHRAARREVRDVFRALHTLKGLAGMVGIDAIVSVAHQAEDVLRAADRTGGHVGPPLLGALVEAADWLERAIRAVDKGMTVIDAPPALTAHLAGAPAGAAAGAPAPSRFADAEIEAKLGVSEKEHLALGVGTGRRAVRADFVPSPAKAARGLNINAVRERAAEVGEIVRIVPLSLPATDASPGGLTFALVLLTRSTDEEIARATGCDRVRTLLATAPAAEAEGAPLDLQGDDFDLQPRTLLRVEAGRIDDAIDGLGALIVTRSRLMRATSALAARGADVRELSAVVGDHTRQLRDLRASLLRVRTTPVRELFEKLPLVARAHTRSAAKSVRLVIEASDAELDKSVAERVFPALVHIVRNAVDHGVEDADSREAAGKPREAVIRVGTAAHSNRLLDIVVSDDGRGVDRARLATRAGTTAALDDRQLLDVMCRPGLSTCDEATATSGRGMGMDIVRRIVVDQLGGELLLATAPRTGTTLTLRVPLTIAIMEAFAVVCAGERFVVPVNAVEAIVDVRSERVIEGPAVDGERLTLVEFRGEAIPIVPLARILRLPGRSGNAGQALLVRRDGASVGFALDRVVGRQEAVVRPLSDPLVRVIGVSGSTDLGDGRATLVLDLLRLAGAMGGRAERAA